jgi:hypothetical protein
LYIDIVGFDSQLSSVCMISFLDTSRGKGGRGRGGKDQLDTARIENLPNYSVALGMIGTIHEVFAIAVCCYCCFDLQLPSVCMLSF